MARKRESEGARGFSVREIKYLQSLPAVEHVTRTRIEYTEGFKVDCLRRYMAGESPAKIFRRAGLDSQLIGYKRIERCIARWKKMYHLDDVRRPSGRSAGAQTQPVDLAAADSAAGPATGETPQDSAVAQTATPGKTAGDGAHNVRVGTDASAAASPADADPAAAGDATDSASTLPATAPAAAMAAPTAPPTADHAPSLIATGQTDGADHTENALAALNLDSAAAPDPEAGAFDVPESERWVAPVDPLSFDLDDGTYADLRYAYPTPRSTRGDHHSDDIYQLIIMQQARRIERLEHEVNGLNDRLRHASQQIQELTKA